MKTNTGAAVLTKGLIFTISITNMNIKSQIFSLWIKSQ